MPFRRRVGSKGFRVKRTLGNSGKPVPSWKQQQEIMNVRRSVRKIQRGVELKWVDRLIDGDSAGSNSFYLLNGIAEGTTAETRVGDEVKATSVQFRYNLSSPTSYTSLAVTNFLARVIIFWDRQANGSAPAVGDLLATDVVTEPLYSPYNYNNNKRFKIVYDKMHRFMPQAGLTSSTPFTAMASTVIVDRRRRLGRTVKYIGTGNTIASVGTNSLYMFVTANQGSSTITAGIRFYHKDA